MENFRFKISKVLTVRLAQILPDLVSPEQRGFIHQRQIKDCICLTYESINMLHQKSTYGNLASKIYISKAFNTLDWNFLIKVLNIFGFFSKFTNWILTILHSTKLFISINGRLEGFFSCSIGVRQGDLFYHISFCITEKVLSRGLSL